MHCNPRATANLNPIALCVIGSYADICEYMDNEWRVHKQALSTMHMFYDFYYVVDTFFHAKMREILNWTM